MKYFWREKNAKEFENAKRVEAPTREQLENELVKKLEDTTGKIEIIFNEKKRAKHCKKDTRLLGLIKDMPENEKQQVVCQEIVVNLWQVLFDMTKFYNLPFYLNGNAMGLNDEKLIERKILSQVSGIKKSEDKMMKLDNIYAYTLDLLNFFKMQVEKVENERKKREKVQGSFLKGKYVWM